MKQRCTSMAFLLTLVLYSVIAAIIFWQFNALNKATNKQTTLKKVPITLSMFQAPAPKIIEPPKVTPPPKVVPPKKPKPIKKKKIVKKKKVIKKKKPKPKPKPKPTPKPKPVEKVEEEIVEEVVEEVYTPPVVTPVATKAKTAPPPPMYSASQVATAEDRYKEELRQTIATLAKNNYPRRAKRRRWEGELTLRFTLHKDGSITNLQIIEKTRRDILNKTAINIIKEEMNMRFKPFFDEIDKETWVFTQPISFSLRR